MPKIVHFLAVKITLVAVALRCSDDESVARSLVPAQLFFIVVFFMGEVCASVDVSVALLTAQRPVNGFASTMNGHSSNHSA